MSADAYRNKPDLDKEPHVLDTNEKEVAQTRIISVSVAVVLSLVVMTFASGLVLDHVRPEPPDPASIKKEEPCKETSKVVPWGNDKECPPRAKMTVNNLNNGQVIVDCTCPVKLDADAGPAK